MPEPTSKPSHADCLRRVCAFLALYLALLALAAALLASRGARVGLSREELAKRLTLCLLAIETIGLAVAVPFLVVCARRVSARAPRIWGVFIPVVGLEVGSLAVCGIAARGAVAWSVLVWSQVFLLAFAFFLAALMACLASLGCRPTTAQLIATAIALAMVGNVFYANVVVEAAATEGAKSCILGAILWSNPWLVVGGSILEADPLRSERLYSWSVISYYAFRYPGAGIGSVVARSLFVAACYALAAALLWAAAWLIARLRQHRPIDVESRPQI